MRTIKDIANDMIKQDNLATDRPIFIVQKNDKIIGVNIDYGYDGYEWREEGGYGGEVATGEIREMLEDLDEDVVKLCNEHGETLMHWERVYHRDNWVFVTACFTRKGCEEYLAINGHNLPQTRIYAEGSFRNAEWRTLYAHLEEVAKWRGGLETI